MMDSVSRRLVLEGYGCETSIKLPTPVQTPFGSKVTVIWVSVDIRYAIVDGEIVVERVCLSQTGNQLGSMCVNVGAKHTGEAWFESEICPEADLLDAVQKDLSSNNSRLRRIMFARWRDATGDVSAGLPQETAANRDVPECLAELTKAAEGGWDVTFTYTKPEGAAETRHVSVRGIWRDVLHATDHKDGKQKNFRLDRISNVRRA